MKQAKAPQRCAILLVACSAILSLPALASWLFLCVMALLSLITSALSAGTGWRLVDWAGIALGSLAWCALAAATFQRKNSALPGWVKAGFGAGSVVQAYLLWHAGSALIYLMLIGPNLLMAAALMADHQARQRILLHR